MDKPIDYQALTQDMQIVIEGLTQNLATVQTLLSSHAGDDSRRVIRSINKQLEQLTSMNKARADQVEQLSELVRITTLLTSTLEIDLVLEDVMDTVIDLTEAERAYLVLYDDQRELQVRAARNWDHERLTEDEINLSYSLSFA
jgi:transcriptional regulator with GAF, ATPase, and Fis domain